MNILMVASEAGPFAKTGGLADVLGALPKALNALGHRVAVVMPRYRSAEARLGTARQVLERLPGRGDASIDLLDGEVPFYFVNCPALYTRDGGLYGDGEGDFPDNHIRFSTLCRAAIAIARWIFRPDVIHCHDWQTGLLPAYLRSSFALDPTFFGVKTLYTIHNLGYQGLFPKETLPEMGLDGSVFHPGGVEFWGRVNCMKAGLVYSDALSTVSRRYAEEIQTKEQGFGLEGILRDRAGALTGILNGVDYAEWNPETDTLIAANYGARDLSGKLACKRDLIAEFGLPEDAVSRPLLGGVSRFASQKGFDLLGEAAPALAAGDASLVVLGTGEDQYEEMFRALALAHPGRIAVRIAYDNKLAHKIEAGADMFLMPSLYEPCGLNQMYSLRYGTVPVVRATGGLDDTIGEGTGFKFEEYSGPALLGAIHAAMGAFQNKAAWTEMMLAGMREDFSWQASASRYSALYGQLTRGPGA